MKKVLPVPFYFLALFPLIAISGFPMISPRQTTEWKAPSAADTIRNPISPNEETVRKGKITFTRFCVPCHGDKGKGDGAASIALNPKPGNLVSPKVQSQKDGAIFWKMTKGKGAMISYDTVLTREQRWELVYYIRNLAKTETKK